MNPSPLLTSFSIFLAFEDISQLYGGRLPIGGVLLCFRGDVGRILSLPFCATTLIFSNAICWAFFFPLLSSFLDLGTSIYRGLLLVVFWFRVEGKVGLTSYSPSNRGLFNVTNPSTWVSIVPEDGDEPTSALLLSFLG